MSKARNTATRRHREKSVKSRHESPEKPENAAVRKPESAGHDDQEKIEYTPMSGCLCRIFWLLLGNVFLALTAYSIGAYRTHLFSWRDALFWLLVGSLVASRYVDVRYLKGVTTDGERATMDDWRRYTIQLILVSAGLWIMAHAFAFFAA